MPTKKQQQFLDGVATGKTDQEAREGVCSRDSIARWKKDPGFLSAYTLAKYSGEPVPNVSELTSEEIVEIATETVVGSGAKLKLISRNALAVLDELLNRENFDESKVQSEARSRLKLLIPLAIDRLGIILADERMPTREVLSAIKMVLSATGVDETIRATERREAMLQVMQIYQGPTYLMARESGMDTAPLLNVPDTIEGDYELIEENAYESREVEDADPDS